MSETETFVPATPADAPAKYIVFNTKTKQIVDVRLPNDADLPAGKGNTVAAVKPGSFRTGPGGLTAEPWPLDGAGS